MSPEETRRRLQKWATWHNRSRHKASSFTAQIEAVEKAVAELEQPQVQVIKACLLHGKSVGRIARDLAKTRRQIMTICDDAMKVLAVSIPMIDRQLESEHPVNG